MKTITPNTIAAAAVVVAFLTLAASVTVTGWTLSQQQKHHEENLRVTLAQMDDPQRERFVKLMPAPAP